MFTRRARIKAVTSLPVRKKTAGAANLKNDSTDKTESHNADKKQSSPEKLSPKNVSKVPEISEKPSKSLKTMRSPAASEGISVTGTNNSNASKGANHRRRTMKPLINISHSNKRKGDTDSSDSLVSKKKSNSSLKFNEKKGEVNALELTNNKSMLPTQELSTNDGIEKNKTVSIDGIIPLSSSLREEVPDVAQPISGSTVLGTDINFDPIIPLPSSKNRPKLKPMPRFSLRRNSFQGSASESEDDNRKNKREESIAPIVISTSSQPVLASVSNRLRNDSVSSLPADSNLHVNLPITPRQKINRTRLITSGEGRRAAAKKRALNKHPLNPLTMCDLIYYNPPINNKKPSEIKKNERKDIEAKEKYIPPILENKITENKDTEESSKQPNAMPVPQVKLGPNGEIVIDEQSLVIETTEATRSREEISKLSVVYENGFGPSSGLYRRTMRTREWSDAETLRFYKALNTIGTDFALMLSLFPGRTRKDLKTKFKKEEKRNIALVDKALMNPLNFDISELQEQLVEEQNSISESKIKKPPKKPKLNYRNSSTALRSMYDSTEIITPIDQHKKEKALTQRKSSISKIVGNERTESDFKNINDSFDNEEDIPKDIEPGSIVILVKKIPNTKNRNTLHAYMSQHIENESKLNPIHIEIDVLMSLAKNMNILQKGQEYEAAKENSKSFNMGTLPNNSEECEPADNSDTLEIDDNILDDSAIDNYILTGKTNLLNDSLTSPNIINLSQS